MARRASVDLDCDARGRRGREHAIPIGVDARTRSKHASARMPEDVDAGRGDGRQHSWGLIITAAQPGMGRRDDDLERAQFRRGHVDAAVSEDVGFDALQHSKPPLIALVERVDLAMLLFEFFHRHATRNRQTVAVIGYGAVTVAEREAAFYDVRQRIAAVAVFGMHLKIAAVLLHRWAA
jgi:hypothetical protein